MVVAGHAYCWDVIGDPAFGPRTAELGVDTVVLAAAYHSTRAATPFHPEHTFVDARHAALYRPIRTAGWSRLRPYPPSWMTDSDPFATAAAEVRASGLGVAAWIVLLHNSRLGTDFPDVTVVNCFGERYPYALCPAREEVREYAATLAAESIQGVEVDAVSLESCGPMGLAHNGQHEKTDGAFSSAAARWLSVCCCTACQADWRRRDLAPDRVVAALRRAVHEGCATVEQATDILTARHAVVDLLRARVVAAVREVAPAAAVTLHAHPDPWQTGPSPGLFNVLPEEIDELLVPAWSVAESSKQAVAGAVSFGRPVRAYVTALSGPGESDVEDHLEALAGAGASGLSLYHLGLAGNEQRRVLRQMTEWQHAREQQ